MPTTDHYNKPVVVLMDAACTGPAEVTLAGLSEVAARVPGTIRLVGTETGRAAGTVRTEGKVADGFGNIS